MPLDSVTPAATLLDITQRPYTPWQTYNFCLTNWQPFLFSVIELAVLKVGLSQCTQIFFWFLLSFSSLVGFFFFHGNKRNNFFVVDD